MECILLYYDAICTYTTYTNMNIQGVGVDIVEVKRFVFASRSHSFLVKVFSKKELDYCFSFQNPSIHLAGHFAAKEACSKALGTEKFPFISLEVRHTSIGAPEIWSGKKKLSVQVSISHTDKIAIAFAITGL